MERISKIYEEATRVICWLGVDDGEFPSTHGTELTEFIPSIAISTLQTISRSGRQSNSKVPTIGLPHSLLPLNPSRSLEALCQLFHRPYWKRLWVIQELTLAKEILVQCGESYFEWKDLARCCDNLEQISEHWLTIRDKKVYRLVCKVKDSIPCRLHRQRKESRKFGEQAHPLLELLFTYSEAQCQDIRDKVFGLHSLAQDCCKREIPVDYGISILEICSGILHPHFCEHQSPLFYSVRHTTAALHGLFKAPGPDEYLERKILSSTANATLKFNGTLDSTISWMSNSYIEVDSSISVLNVQGEKPASSSNLGNKLIGFATSSIRRTIKWRDLDIMSRKGLDWTPVGAGNKNRMRISISSENFLHYVPDNANTGDLVCQNDDSKTTFVLHWDGNTGSLRNTTLARTDFPHDELSLIRRLSAENRGGRKNVAIKLTSQTKHQETGQCNFMMLTRRTFQCRNIGSRFCQLRRLATAVDPLVSERNGNQQHGDNRVKIVEVGPRDGLQNEKTIIPLATKIELIEKLAKTGLQDIEAGSFVSPKWVPQMADTSEILKHVLQNHNESSGPIRYSFLAPNKQGLGNAMDILHQNRNAYNTADVPIDHSSEDDISPNKPYIEMAVFAAATESFSQKNLNCDIATSLKRFEKVIQGAKAAGMRVRAYISVVLGCPFEGDNVDPHRVAEIATELLEMGADEIDLGDTTGMGTGPKTSKLLRTMQSAGILNEDIAMHFHDTYGQALINTVVSLEHGIRTFDSSVGGLGGCPYSPGATGNVATEDMVYLLESMGMQTGVDLDALADIGQWITGVIGKPNASRAGKAVIGARSRK
ncbi:hypothetical protein NHQ30_008556 [Ciborinia camelliae]|nr:hypothetical protein NHQ30_008556 [Ciborinia camelliae]